jgi:hypothetical protein
MNDLSEAQILDLPSSLKPSLNHFSTTIPAPSYQRASTEWLSECGYGVAFHWTAHTIPERGSPLPFPQAVEKFQLESFLTSVKESGAGYVIFTATHALHRPPCPNPVIDALLPGRTCERDLIGEIADGLEKMGKHLIVYYNHSCNHKEDLEWEHAIGYHGTDKSRFTQNFCDIIEWMGKKYGSKIKGWWYDSCWALDPRGPLDDVTTDLQGYQFPWEKLTKASKQGYSDRLVTYNPGLNESFLLTDHQDYWAGEMDSLKIVPHNKIHHLNGLPWHGWMCLDNKDWVHGKVNTRLAVPQFERQAVLDYLKSCIRYRAPVCFNLDIVQNGTVSPHSVNMLSGIHKELEMDQR